MRTHCFISATSEGLRGACWAWHTADDKGISRSYSQRLFPSFNECVDDAYAHGHRHVEVPVLPDRGRAAMRRNG